MSQPAPGTELLRALAAAALGEGEPAALAARAAAALGAVFRARKSLVIDVQFTGFLFKGKPLGNVDSELLRAAGRLIVLRITRVGFTPDAAVDDLEAFFRTLTEPGADGVLATVAAARPHGIYLASTSGEVYRPPPRPKPVETQGDSADGPAAAPAEEAAPVAETSVPRGGETPAAAPVPFDGFDAFEGDGLDLSDFELLDDFPAIAPTAPSSRPAAPAGGGGAVGNEMFHFFRTTHSDRAEVEVERLSEALRTEENPTHFDELAESATRAVQRLVRSDAHAQAAELIDALVREAERADRTRLFRESARQALARVGTADTLHRLLALLEHAGGEERERILHFCAFMGGEAAQGLEALLFRTGDAELRVALFRHMARMEGAVERIAARSLAESPGRARVMLELAARPELPSEAAVHWVAGAAAHLDPSVRGDAARLAAAVGGRGGLRVLLDLLVDREPAVKRAAAQALGSLGDTSAVPFLARVVSDGGDEEVQVAAIAALGRLRSGEALSTLLGVVNRRGGLFGAKKLSRPRVAAIAAIGRIPTQAAREAIHSLAGGKDAEIAAEAQRVLGTLD
jgi:hypothetical protein